MTSANPALLLTKLYPPPVTSDLVIRPRLLEQLNAGIDRPMTLVCAPAGFGKTTLVSSWIEHMRSSTQAEGGSIPAAWVSLDKYDSEVPQFAQYWIAALRTVHPDACEDSLQLIQGTTRPTPDYLSTSLCNEMQQLPGRLILVLDDYHTIQGEAVPNLLNAVLQHWPHSLHLVLISRTNPAVPLPRVRANGLLTEIRSNDLRFEQAETAAFLSRSLQATVSEPAVTKLNQRMEGWIGALRLATLSLRTTGNIDDQIARMTGVDENIADYLMDEVLSRQFPAIQAFLLKTSILDRFCAPLCEAVIGESDPAWNVRTCIDWLERTELLITPLDTQKVWYRYHHLLQEFLRLRLSTEMAPNKVKELHSRAAAWYEEQGLIDEALKHTLLADDLELAATLVGKGLREVLNREDRRTLERWLHLLPEDAILKRSWLAMVKAWVLHFSWQLNTLSKFLDQVETRIEMDSSGGSNSEELELLRSQIHAMRGQEAYYNNRHVQAKELCQKAIELIPSSWKFLRGGAAIYLGLSMQASGEGKAAERLLLNLYEPLEDKTDSYALRLLFPLGMNHLNDGLLGHAQQVASTMLQQASLSRLPIMLGWAHFFLGMVHYQWNELDAAMRHFAELASQRYMIHAQCARNGMTGMALIHQMRGESAAAWEALELLNQFNLEQTGQAGDAASSLRARLLLMQGEVDNACRWADAYTTPPPDAPLLWLEEPQLTQARILISRGGNADLLMALQILDALHQIAERTFNTRFAIHIQALRAVALDALGKTQEALDALGQAVELAKPGGFIRAFAALEPRMPQLLGKLAQQGHSAEWIQRILAALSLPESLPENTAAPVNSAPIPSSALVEPLTRREFEILALLRQPMSFKEIAFKLGISYATVKRHSINLYAKLAVNSRWDAVARAVELGILPAR